MHDFPVAKNMLYALFINNFPQHFVTHSRSATDKQGRAIPLIADEIKN